MENPNVNPWVATAGEALIDLIGQPDGRFLPCLGGAVYNLTRALAMQGVPTVYLNPLSTDRFGRALAQGLLDAGVVLAQPRPVPQPTALAVVSLSDHGQPDYAFYRDGVADRAVDASALREACDKSPSLRLVCTGALALAPDDGPVYRPWLAAQRTAGRTVVVDANLRPQVMPDLPAYRQHVRDVLTLADGIKVSDDDLTALEAPGATPLDQARGLLAASGASWLALTLGANGAWLLSRDGRHWHAREAKAVTVVDTVGAGDCFLAGLLGGLLDDPDGAGRHWSDELATAALARAVSSASLCVTRVGCAPPTRAEVLARLRSHPLVTAPPG